jgi:hypothetical protein
MRGRPVRSPSAKSGGRFPASAEAGGGRLTKQLIDGALPPAIWQNLVVMCSRLVACLFLGRLPISCAK